MKHKIKVQKGRWPSTFNLWYVVCLSGCEQIMVREDGLFGRVTREEAHAIGVKHQTRHTNVPGAQCAACEVIGDKLAQPGRDAKGRFIRNLTPRRHDLHTCGPAC